MGGYEGLWEVCSGFTGGLWKVIHLFRAPRTSLLGVTLTADHNQTPQNAPPLQIDKACPPPKKLAALLLGVLIDGGPQSNHPKPDR